MKTLRELYEGLMVRMLMGLKNEKGQTMIEYALVAVLIAIVLVFIFKNSGVDSGISTAASKVNSALQ
jgi:pilus assembly protein Flp/PilA